MDVLHQIGPRKPFWARTAGILFGVTNHLVFAVTAWYLFFFLISPQGRESDHALLIDVLLALQFAVSHSFWLWPSIRGKLGRSISRSFYGCFYCLMTCFSLGLVMWQWRTIPGVVWQTTGSVATAIWFGYIGSWIGLFYSVSLTGPGFQTGFTEWIHWVKRRPIPPRTFTPRGAYLMMRHPVYLSFLGLLWFAPTMSLDHALLTGLWTVYIFVGSWLKDHRLVRYLGNSYRDYATRVSGYPGMFLGPLARWNTVKSENS